MEVQGKLVSVIIASYRNLEGVFDTLESVLMQTYDNIEIIVTDDGSPDYSKYEPKLREYIRNNRCDNIQNVILKTQEKNVGTVRNLNSAIKISQGYFIKLISSEDRLKDENSLQEYVDFMLQTDFQIIFGKIRGVTPNGEYVYRLLSCEDDYDKLKSYSPEQTRDYLFRRNFLPAPASFIKHTVFDKYGLFPEDVRLIEDYPYWIHLALNGVKFGYIDKVMVDARLSGVSSAGVYNEAFMKDMFVIYNKFIFPYDQRYRIFQKLYNWVKRQGLNFYMTKAKWPTFSRTVRFRKYLQYSIFFFYTYVQRKMVEKKNKRKEVG